MKLDVGGSVVRHNHDGSQVSHEGQSDSAQFEASVFRGLEKICSQSTKTILAPITEGPTTRALTADTATTKDADKKASQFRKLRAFTAEESGGSGFENWIMRLLRLICIT